MVQVRLFGGVGATTDAGDPADIGPAKCQLVLAALALEPRRRAFGILRDHASDLRERRDLYEARLLCVEVVNLLVTEDRTADAARLLGYLEESGLLANPAFAAIVRDSTDLIERTVADHTRLRAAGRRLDDAAALDLVHGIAGELAQARPEVAP